jgi:hypothetical protein
MGAVPGTESIESAQQLELCFRSEVGHWLNLRAARFAPIGSAPDQKLGKFRSGGRSPSENPIRSARRCVSLLAPASSKGACATPRDFVMTKEEEIRFRLTIPIADAFAFAMGVTDLHYADASDDMRQVIGLLVIDNLEYFEHWRVSTEVRACLAARWPESFAF